MHRALIVPSHYEPTSGYPDRPGRHESTLALANRLKERGYEVEVLLPGAGLVRNLRQALATEDPLSAVVVVFSGYVLLTESSEPAILLCDEQVIALRVEQLASKASRTFGRVLLVIDGARGSSTRVVMDAAAQAGMTGTTPESMLAQMAVRSIDGENIGALVRVEPWTVPESGAQVGLCEALDSVLLGLEEKQVLSTSELEHELHHRLDATQAALELKHSKPAFIFLPARRFTSEPPNPGATSGSPPPLPGERRADPHSPMLPAPPPLPGERIAAPPAITAPPAPPPLPAEREAAAPLLVAPPAPPPLPVERQATAASSAPLAPPRLPDEANIPSASPKLSVPPPLPLERAGAPTTLPPAAAAKAEEATASSAPAAEQMATHDVSVVTPSDDEQAGSPAVDETPAVAEHVDETPAVAEPEAPAVAETPAVAEPAVAEPEAPAVSQAPAANVAPITPEQPAVEHADEDIAASALEPLPTAAPSIPPAGEQPGHAPPVLSPESWRPGPSGGTARDEAALLAQAQEAWRAGQSEQALSIAKTCLNSFPESAHAMQIAAAILAQSQRFEELAQLYEELIALLAPNPAASQLCASAARLWATQLNDTSRAKRSLQLGLELDSNNSSLHREMAELLETSGDDEGAARHSLLAVQLNPMSVPAAKAAFIRLRKQGRSEAVFTTACLLSVLGQGDNEALEVVAAQRTGSLPRPARALEGDDFALGLNVVGHDAALTRAFALLEPVCRRAQMPKLKQQRQIVEALRAEDVAQSTTMLARTFGWTCRLLALGVPALFLAETDELPSLLPIEPASFRVGKALGRGLSLTELVFLWGRCLGLSRPETRIVLTYPSTGELLTLLRAAHHAAGLDATPAPETKSLAKLLKKHGDRNTWSAVAESLGAVDGDLTARVSRWKRQVDDMANRVGLVACGDPELAARTLERFPTAGSAPIEKQVASLMSFALSEPYGELRRRLGLHLG